MCVVNAAVGFLTTCLHLTPVVQQVSISYEFIRGLWGRSPVEYRGRASNQGAVAPPEAEISLAVGCPNEAVLRPQMCSLLGYFQSSNLPCRPILLL